MLIAAISHVTSKRVLARAQPVSLSRIELAVSRVDTALQRLGPVRHRAIDSSELRLTTDREGRQGASTGRTLWQQSAAHV